MYVTNLYDEKSNRITTNNQKKMRAYNFYF